MGASTAGTTLDAPSRSGSPALSSGSESELSLLLDGFLEHELPCEAAYHRTNALHHSPADPATVRGIPPCGSALNICEKYAGVVQALAGQSFACYCGTDHLVSSFRFVKI